VSNNFDVRLKTLSKTQRGMHIKVYFLFIELTLVDRRSHKANSIPQGHDVKMTISGSPRFPTETSPDQIVLVSADVSTGLDASLPKYPTGSE
jgi:hypothetical protein